MLAVGYALDSFEMYIINKKEFTDRTDCEAIVKFYSKLHENKRSSRRIWLNFIDKITNRGFRVVFEHIKGKENSLADTLRRFISTKQKFFDTVV